MLFRCALEEMFICVRNQSNDGEQALFEQISQYIHEHYMDALTVRALAEQNEINENRLFYVFKKYTGMEPGKYLMAYRLNRAKECLLANDAPIGEVAHCVGYTDAFYFSRIFKKQFGVSPGEFRATFRNNPYIWFSGEGLAAMNPDYMFVADIGGSSKNLGRYLKSLESDSVWNSLDAIKNGQMYALDSSIAASGPLAIELGVKTIIEKIRAQ